MKKRANNLLPALALLLSAMHLGACSAFAERIVVWGYGGQGHLDAPAGDDFVAIAASAYHCLALRSDGTITSWGRDWFGLRDLPTGDDFVAIAACWRHCLALRANGTVVAWGINSWGEGTVPHGHYFKAIACGNGFSLGLRTDGSLAAWGAYWDGQCDVPEGRDFVAISAGSHHSLALRSDGSITAWGVNSSGECNVPPDNGYIAITAGSRFSVALKADGSLIAWGVNSSGQCDVPAGSDFVAISGGANHCLALRADGSLAVWGGDDYEGGEEPPEGNDFVKIATGANNSLALVVNPETTYHVDADASGNNDGSSWANAFTNLQDAFTAAVRGANIRVAQGTYKPDEGAGLTPGDRTASFLLAKGVTIKGGYAGLAGPDPNLRDIKKYASILSGDIGIPGYDADNSYHVLRTDDTTRMATLLDGLTITGGNADGSSYGDVRGGGITMREGTSPTFVNCTFRANMAETGGAIYTGPGNPKLTNCVFIENRAESGGAIYGFGNGITLTNCAVTRNSANNGGGMSSDSSFKATLVNCIFSANSADYGGAINSTYDSLATLVNCTFADNSAIEGRTLAFAYGTSFQASNCILWNDGHEIWHGGHDRDYTIAITYSNVAEACPGRGNISADPRFAAGSDYHLSPDSPCIDTGTNDPNAGLPLADADGSPRPLDGDGDANAVADMGAYEFHPHSPAIVISPSALTFSVPLGQEDSESKPVLLRNAGGAALHWRLTEDHPHISASSESGCLDPGSSAELLLTADSYGLAHGTSTCHLTVSDPCAANSPQTIVVTLNVTTVLHVPQEFPTIQQAVDAAIDGDVILLADGIYTGLDNRDLSFRGKAISIRSRNGPTNCVIDCQGQGRGIHFQGSDSPAAEVNGITICNGWAECGGAVYCSPVTSPTIRNCIIRDNESERYDYGAIHCDNSNATIINCIFAGNYRRAISVTNSCSLTITNCTFAANSTYDGAVLYCWSHPDLYPSSVQVTNCILWNDGRSIMNSDDSEITVTYSNVQGGYPGEGNIDADPCFAFSGDYHLMPDSPCIDAGTAVAVALPAADIDGNLRDIDGNADTTTAPDMGAYERNPNRPAIAVSARNFDFGYTQKKPAEVPQTLFIKNCGGPPLHWRVVEDCPWLQAVPASGITTGRTDQVTLSIVAEPGTYGDHLCTLEVVDPSAANSPVTVQVWLYVPHTLLVPAEFPTIQQAVDAARGADTILIDDGVYSGQGNRDIDFRKKAITIRSSNGPANCIIDCNATRSDPHCAFSLRYVQDQQSVIEGLTIKNGYAPRGAAVFCQASNTVISNCIITDNTSFEYGGAIYCGGVSTLITDCIISRNYAAQAGGAIYSQSDRFRLANCKLADNSTAGYGGAVCKYVHSLADTIVSDCTFIANTADIGGAVYFWGDDWTVEHCRFSGNRALDSGGAMYAMPVVVFPRAVSQASDETVIAYSDFIEWPLRRIRGCIFEGNLAAVRGGAVYISGANGHLSNCTFYGNSALYGSALVLAWNHGYYVDHVRILDCIFWDDGLEVWDGDTYGIEAVISHSNIRGGRESVYDPRNAVDWGPGNLDVEPFFVDPGRWDPNGTPEDVNDDFWIAGDYHLMSEGWRWDADRSAWTWDETTSRCIDSGNPGSPLAKEPLSTPWDPNNLWGRNLRINMGSHGGTAEASIPPQRWALLSDITNDGHVDFTDFTHLSADWLASAEDQPGDYDRSSQVALPDLAILANDWLEKTTWSVFPLR